MSTITDRIRRFIGGEEHTAGPIQAIWNGTVIAESDRTVRLEGNHYFPYDDISRGCLESNSRTSVCPWKGTASYYDVVVDGERNSAAAWCYPRPSAAAQNIKGRVAFWNGVKIRRVPQS